jgi:hypothetical protein
MRKRDGFLSILFVIANVLSFPVVSQSQSQGDILGEDLAQQDRKFSEVRREWELAGTDRDGSAADARRRAPRRYVTLMQHDSEFNLGSIPLSVWLKDGQAADIPWSVEVNANQLRMDQRTEVSYKARVAIKHLNKYGSLHDLFFIVGVSGQNGDWVVQPKVVHAIIRDKLNDNDELWFSDWVFSMPGRYELWFVLYDRQVGKHSIARRHVEVRPLRGDPLPHLSDRLPVLEFPRVSDREGGSVLGLYGSLNLPVRNKQRSRIELIQILNYTDTAPTRKSVHEQSEKMVAIINTLSQMSLANGSVSMTAVDVKSRRTPFRHVAAGQLNWADLFQVLLQTNELGTVSKTDVSAERGAATFLSQTINDQLTGCNEPVRILMIISSAPGFGQGQPDPVTLPNGCKLRLFHFRLDGDGNGSGLLPRILLQLQPTTFHIRNALDFRKALASVIRELELL